VNWLIKLLPSSWVETFVRKQAGVWINKGLQAVAVYLVSHNLLAQTASESWIAANADFIIGVIVALVSAYLTKARGEVRSADLVTAHQTDANAVPQFAPAKSVIAGGGVGMGNTEIGGKLPTN